jgi:HEPN domain-containing protein
MQPDSRRHADTLSWFRKTYNDLRYADIDLAASPPAPEDALFHCQQAAEKALKGFLVWHDQPFPKTHDLGKLGSQVIRLDPALDALIEQIVELTKYAWMFRYPGDAVAPEVAEAQDALLRTRRLVEALLSRLPDAVQAITPNRSGCDCPS